MSSHVGAKSTQICHNKNVCLLCAHFDAIESGAQMLPKLSIT